MMPRLSWSSFGASPRPMYQRSSSTAIKTRSAPCPRPMPRTTPSAVAQRHQRSLSSTLATPPSYPRWRIGGMRIAAWRRGCCATWNGGPDWSTVTPRRQGTALMLESSRPGTSRAACLADGRAEQVYGGVTVYSCMAFAKMTQTGRRRQQHVGLAKGAEPGGPGYSVFPRTVD